MAPLGTDQYLVSVTVSGAGANGCDAPTFTGFQTAGTTLVAQIARRPAPPDCAIVSAVTFYVALDRLVVPETVTRIVTGDPCEGPRCAAVIPTPSG